MCVSAQMMWSAWRQTPVCIPIPVQTKVWSQVCAVIFPGTVCTNENPIIKVGIDMVGQLPVTANGNMYVIILMDYFSKWPEGQTSWDSCLISLLNDCQICHKINVWNKVSVLQLPHVKRLPCRYCFKGHWVSFFVVVKLLILYFYIDMVVQRPSFVIRVESL